MAISTSKFTTTHLFLLLAIGIFFGSFGPLCVRFAQQSHMPADVITTIRMGSSAILVTPIIFLKYRSQLLQMTGRDILLALTAGAMFGINVLLFVISLEHIGIMINQVLVGTGPIWVAIIEVVILKARFSKYVWFGIFVSFIGGFIIAISTVGEPAIKEGGNTTFGVILAILSAITAAVYLTIGRKARATAPFAPYIWLVYTGGGLAALIATFFNHSPLIGYEPAAYLWVLLLAIIAQLIAHGIFNYILGYISATLITVVGQSSPILSAIWSFIIFREAPTWLQILGSGVIIVGVVLVINAQSKKLKRQD